MVQQAMFAICVFSLEGDNVFPMQMRTPCEVFCASSVVKQ
jgi:hypothetical protein